MFLLRHPLPRHQHPLQKTHAQNERGRICPAHCQSSCATPGLSRAPFSETPFRPSPFPTQPGQPFFFPLPGEMFFSSPGMRAGQDAGLLPAPHTQTARRPTRGAHSGGTRLLPSRIPSFRARQPRRFLNGRSFPPRAPGGTGIRPGRSDPPFPHNRPRTPDWRRP